MTVSLDKRLLGTRDKLLDVLDELRLDSTINPNNIWQCINCSIWTKNALVDETDDSTFCPFCFDETNFKL